jgi:hypothetical protein
LLRLYKPLRLGTISPIALQSPLAFGVAGLSPGPVVILVVLVITVVIMMVVVITVVVMMAPLAVRVRVLVRAVRARADLVVQCEDLLDRVRLQVVTPFLRRRPLAVLEGLLSGQ